MDYKEICKRLVDNGYKAYIVGGAVRDELLKVPKSDVDIATNASPTGIIRLFRDQSPIMVGKSFGVVMVNGVEVATLRKDRFIENYNASSCRPTFTERVEEDLERRDLTINAMAINFKSGELIDLFGGVEDLQNKVIRFVGNPYERIKEDPCRIIRACRFFALTGGSFEKQTLKALTDSAELVPQYVAYDRIRKEIIKALVLEYPSLFFCALHLVGALKFIFKSMDSCFNHHHGKYHKETIGEHIMLTGDNLSPKDPILRLAGYLHDVGKPYAFDGENFISHEKYGSNLARKELRRLHFSNHDIKRICNLIYVHMRQCRSLRAASSRRLQKTFNDLGVNPRDFVRLKLADRTANVNNDSNKLSMIKPMLINTGIVKVEEHLPMTVKDLALSGGEIIEIFNLEPGPIIGKIQRELLNYVLTYGEERNDKDHLINIAHTFIGNLQ